MSRRLAVVVIPLLLTVGALAACTESTRIPAAEPSSAVEPLFSSDEEALAAATEAYEEYLAVVDLNLSNPIEDANAFEDVATGDALEEVRGSLATFLEDGLRVAGSRAVVNADLQQRTPIDDSEEVRIYVCESVAGLDLLGPTGESLVQPGRPEVTAFEVAVTFTEIEALVSERVVWPDGGLCDLQ